MLNKLNQSPYPKSSDTISLINKFAEAISEANLFHVKRIIQSNKKSFEIGNNVMFRKTGFLTWLKDQINEFQIDNPNQHIPFELDICDGCQIGCTVVIFNGGTFPKYKHNALFKYTAWNIEAKDGYITAITICNSTPKLRAHEDYAF